MLLTIMKRLLIAYSSSQPQLTMTEVEHVTALVNNIQSPTAPQPQLT